MNNTPLTALLLLAAIGCGRPGSPPIHVTVLEPTPVVAPAPIASVEASPEVTGVPPLPEVTDVSDFAPDLARYTLRRGETLAHFARWSGQPIEEVARTSGLELDGLYAVGTEVALELSPEDRARVEQRRDAHHQTRAESFLASRDASGTGFYRVRTGDSAWSIAQRHQAIPVWLLETLNPSVDLERLRPGQELLVPTWSESVVDAE